MEHKIRQSAASRDESRGRQRERTRRSVEFETGIEPPPPPPFIMMIIMPSQKRRGTRGATDVERARAGRVVQNVLRMRSSVPPLLSSSLRATLSGARNASSLQRPTHRERERARPSSPPPPPPLPLLLLLPLLSKNRLRSRSVGRSGTAA